MTTIKTLALCLTLTLTAGTALAQEVTAPAAPPVTAPVPAADAATLALAFPELKQKTGVIMIALFDSLDGWKSGKAVRVAVAAAADPEPVARFAGLAAGTYAARVFQDLDGDGKMGANPFGLPTEPYGFSNGAKANMGPPSFQEASFAVIAGENLQTIALK